MPNKTRKPTTQSVSARIPSGDYNKIMKIAEEENTNVSHIIKLALNSYFDDRSIERHFLKFKSLLLTHIFEITSSVSGINETQKREAKDKYNQIMKKKAKNNVK